MHLQIISPIQTKEFMNSNVASYRLRLSFVYRAAKDLGYNVTSEVKINNNADIYYIGKLTRGMENTFTHIINRLRESKSYLLIDYTDDLLDSKIDNERSKIYRELMSLNSVVTVPVEGLGKKIRERGKKVFVIPDGVDNLTNVDPAVKKNKETNILWNGHSSNLSSLIRVITTELLEYKYNLHIISNKKSFEILKKTHFKKTLKCKPFVYLWSISNLVSISKKCDFLSKIE